MDGNARQLMIAYGDLYKIYPVIEKKLTKS